MSPVFPNTNKILLMYMYIFIVHYESMTSSIPYWTIRLDTLDNMIFLFGRKFSSKACYFSMLYRFAIFRVNCVPGSATHL
jgi:hypothetical protein